MIRTTKTLGWILLAFNAIVLLGQIWPEGAPPFARVVNIGVLAVDVAVLLRVLTSPRG